MPPIGGKAINWKVLGMIGAVVVVSVITLIATIFIIIKVGG